MSAVQYDYDADNLFEQVTDRMAMEDSTFLQMSNGSIRQVDPVDETMSLIQRRRRFRPNSYAETQNNEHYEMTPYE